MMNVSPNLIVHHLRFQCEVLLPVHLGPQAGAQIRGAFWEALKGFACTASGVKQQADHAAHCPMCRLVALETTTAPRGNNPARPFAIQPPLAAHPEEDRYYRPGQVFTFGISLFGDAADLFPYILQAVHRIGQRGVGYGRGTFRLAQAQAVNPLTGQKQGLLEGSRAIAQPSLPVTGDVVNQATNKMISDRVQLHFLTQVQLTAEGSQFCNTPRFDVLIARLLERCQAIEGHYTAQPTPQPAWREAHLTLSEQARQVRMVENQTRWIRVRSGSRRSNTTTPIGGLIGNAIYEGDLKPFLHWLLWGQSLHVGKNAAKGCGWYEVKSG